MKPHDLRSKVLRLSFIWEPCCVRAVPISFILPAFPFPHPWTQSSTRSTSDKKPCRVALVSNRLEVTSKFGACYSNQSAIR